MLRSRAEGGSYPGVVPHAALYTQAPGLRVGLGVSHEEEAPETSSGGFLSQCQGDGSPGLP